MSAKNLDKATIWVICAACGHHHRNHRVLFETIKRWVDEPGPGSSEIKRDYHRLAECMGCETIKYVISSMDLVQVHEFDGPDETDFIVYPDAPGNATKRPMAISSDDATNARGEWLIPKAVWKMYRETIGALNADIRTLAGGGLRAVVEAICLDKKVTKGTLVQKIESLASQGFLTRAQADLLHEERYLGNAALHELATPSTQDIEDGLGIVEGLITTIYVLPTKAARLKKRRESKGRSASKSKKE
jgi:Domain of unknown function (DUF4145)